MMIFIIMQNNYLKHNAGKVPLRLIGVGVAGLQHVDDSFYIYFTDKSS